jgi:hypothetical protein
MKRNLHLFGFVSRLHSCLVQRAYGVSLLVASTKGYGNFDFLWIKDQHREFSEDSKTRLKIGGLSRDYRITRRGKA